MAFGSQKQYQNSYLKFEFIFRHIFCSEGIYDMYAYLEYATTQIRLHNRIAKTY